MPARSALRRSLGGLICNAALVASLAIPAYGFKPKSDLGHQDIVREALRGQRFRTRDGINIIFDESVIEVIAAADAAVDDGVPDKLRGRCASSKKEFCKPEAHCDDELLPECSERVAEIRRGLLALRLPLVDVDRARRDFGRALHTIQDFYAHSNWVNDPGPARTTIQPNLGKVRLLAAPGGITCDSSASELRGEGLTQITSGYFRIPRFDAPMPAGKCAHGFIGITPFDGINKDDPDRPFFDEARALAVLHTREYVREIFSQWDEGGMQSFMRELAAPTGTLGVVVDATGDAAAELAGLRLVAAQLDRDAPELGHPDRYLLAAEPSSSPQVRSLRSHGELEQALAQLEVEQIAMAPHEAPEESPEPQLLRTIAAAPSSSALFLYTDRCAEPAGELSAAIAAAREKQTAVHVIFTQACPAAEGPYRRLAQQSGGQLLRSSPTELEQTAAWMRPWLGAEPQALLQHSGRLTGVEHVIEVPVDSTVRELHVSVAADSLQELRVFDPQGQDVSDAGRFARLSNSIAWGTPQPAPGAWTLRIRGVGAFEVSALARSPIGLGRFALTEQRGLHEGSFFPLQAPAQAGLGAAEAAVYGPAAGVRFELRTPQGEIAQRFELAEGQRAYSRNRFQGALQLPAGTLWVYAHGVDPSGYPFVRMFRQPLDVQPAGPGGARPR